MHMYIYLANTKSVKYVVFAYFSLDTIVVCSMDASFLLPHRYHRWMLSEELRQLTASEPLTLDEEFRMQKSWREDEDSNYLYLAAYIFMILDIFLNCNVTIANVKM